MEIIIFILCIAILCLFKIAEDALSEIREIEKRQFLYAKLLNLNAFFFYKSIPSDRYNMIIKEAREKGLYPTKEEIDSFSEQLNRMEENKLQ